MNLSFEKKDNVLLLKYDSSYTKWVDEKLESEGEVIIGKIFFFSKDDLFIKKNSHLDYSIFSEDSEEKCFILGKKRGDYFVIGGEKLAIDKNVFIDHSIKFNISMFKAPPKVSFSRVLSKLVDGDIFIGGSSRKAIPEAEFRSMVKRIPNRRELDKYTQARIYSIATNYLPMKKNYVDDYHSYINKKGGRKGTLISDDIKDYEYNKYSRALKKIEDMLASENEYAESQWQREVLDILLLIFPKYYRAFREGPLIDNLNNKNRKVDFILVDFDGNVDLLEIKKPFGTNIVTKYTYRDNHIPIRELSGVLMQIEKYLYYLVRSGDAGEKKISDRYSGKLPDGLEIRVANPRGLVLIGRDANLESKQKLDFELIRRQYRNIVDIITYDDLLRRLKMTIKKFA